METIAVEISDYELERRKPIPSKNHGIVQANLLMEIGAHYRKSFRLISEINVSISGRVLVPDIGIFPKMAADMANDQIVVEELPLTTIEILLPTHALKDLTDKARAYFQAGVKSCWIVLPDQQGVFVYSGPNEYEYFHGKEILRDSATEIELDLAPLFE